MDFLQLACEDGLKLRPAANLQPHRRSWAAGSPESTPFPRLSSPGPARGLREPACPAVLGAEEIVMGLRVIRVKACFLESN